MLKNQWQTLWPEIRQTLQLATPIITSQIGQLLLGLVDTIMIGRLGVTPLAASAFAISVFHIFLIFGFGVASCISPLVARADGAQSKRECGEILRHGILFIACWAVLLALCVEFLARNLKWFEQPFEILELAKNFLIIMGWSMLPALLFQVLRQYSEGLARVKLPMLIMLCAVFLNAFLNWLLIYGNWGFPRMELTGAAWSTFITRMAMLLTLLLYIVRSPKFHDYLPPSWTASLHSWILRKMFSLGVPSAFQTLFEVGAFCGSTIIMGWIGTEALAAHQIGLSVASLTFMVPLGISFATSIRVSNALGKKDFGSIRRLGLGGIGFGAAAMAYLGAIMFIGQHWIPTLYVQDSNVVHIASQLLVVAAIFQIADGAQCIALGALRGLHDVKFPTAMTFVAYAVIAMPLVYLLGITWHFGPVGIWVGLLIGLAIAAISATVRFWLLTGRKQT